MSPAKIAVDLDRLLAPLGFRRRRSTWNKGEGAFVDVIDIQIDKSGDSVTVNVGVLERQIYAQCWQNQADEFVEEPACIVRTRLGMLMADTDKWWPIDRESTSKEIHAALERLALPFLQKMHSLEAMSAWLEASDVKAKSYPPPIIYLALLRHKLGDPLKGCSILKELDQKVRGGWKKNIETIAGQLSCSRCP